MLLYAQPRTRIDLNLTNDPILKIALDFIGWRDVLALSESNKRMYTLLSNPIVWEKHYDYRFCGPTESNKIPLGQHKSVFMERHEAYKSAINMLATYHQPTNPWFLEHDREYVLFLIKKGFRPLNAFRAPELQPHREIILIGVSWNGNTLQYASPKLQSDRAIVLATVTLNGNALQYASPELQSDRAIVLAAVSCNRNALQYASAELRSDRDIVLAAVQKHGDALQYASLALRSDRAIVLAAIQGLGGVNAFRHASEDLKNDQWIVFTSVLQEIASYKGIIAMVIPLTLVSNDPQFFMIRLAAMVYLLSIIAVVASPLQKAGAFSHPRVSATGIFAYHAAPNYGAVQKNQPEETSSALERV
jgi:hypothetical protein